MSEDRNTTLSPPSPQRQSFEDPGAHELESDSDDHFSDARSDRDNSSRAASPIPITRVERVDHEASYGEVPGTAAYDTRAEDARPDEVAFIEEDQKPEIPASPISRPLTPGGQPIPRTVLEEAPRSPVLGALRRNSTPRTHSGDALPDLVVHTPELENTSPTATSPGGLPIPSTRVEKVDSVPSYGEVPGTEAFKKRTSDAIPDDVEETGDVSGTRSSSHTSLNDRLTEPGSPTSSTIRSSSITPLPQSLAEATSESKDYDEEEDGDESGFGDDFDDFEEGGEDAEFGDFDDGFQEAGTPTAPVQSLPHVAASFPVLNFDDLDSPEEVLDASKPYINALFAPDTIDTSILPAITPENPIFLTQRSASLWSQLVAPPPLQPPNWIRSRIRRLFLVSLGVPIDLDEILPASKQKKLVLPSINLSSSSPRNSTDSRAVGSVSRLRATDGNTSNTSVDSQGKPTTSRRRKGPPPAPDLDLVYAQQLCSVTSEALAGLTVEELKDHVAKLEAMQGTAKEVLEYWTKRTDEKLGDREAFEGVIENLVKHARKVRK